MRRQAQATFLSRSNLKNLIGTIEVRPLREWPHHLAMAGQLLQSTPSISIPVLQHVMVEAIDAAHHCAVEINARSKSNVQFQSYLNVCNAFRRIANCAKRGSKDLRKCLQENVRSHFQNETMDLESIEAILDSTAAAFREFRDEEPSITAFAVLGGTEPTNETANVIKNDYTVLGRAVHDKCETAIVDLVSERGPGVPASDIFKALADAVESETYGDKNLQIYDLIVGYVIRVARSWQSAGPRPARARHPDKPDYTSKFHLFVELILTAMVEPWSRRHEGNLADFQQRIALSHAKLRPALRRKIGKRLNRRDSEWLVSDDHVKKALRALPQKTTADTP